MQRYKIISVLLICVVLCNGCSTGDKQTNDTALPKEDNASEITVEVQDYGANFYANAARKFEKETGIKVNIINDFKKGESGDEFDANEQRIQAELMAGKGADIYAGIYLDFSGIGKNKHLCNLANWIAKDSEFSDNTYYMNILKSGFDHGDEYAVPLFLNFTAMGSIVEVPELQGKSYNWEEFFELTKGIKRSGVLCGLSDYRIFKRRFEDRQEHYVDKKSKTQTLDSPEMVKLLEQCKQWSSEGLCVPLTEEDNTDITEKSFFKITGGGIETLINMRFDSPKGDDEPYLYDIPSDSGKYDKSNKIASLDNLCINAASQYKGTAWKFVKFLLSEDIQATGLYTPVNRKAAAEHTSEYLTQYIEAYHMNIDPKQAVKEVETILDSVEKVPNIDLESNAAEVIVLKEAKRYFSDEISADAAAKNMAKRVTLYLKEQ